jgi:hypothetical protein
VCLPVPLVRSMTRGAILLHSHWQIAAGLLAGLVLIPPLHVEYAAWREARHESEQRALPVVTPGPLVIVERTDTYVDLRLTGHKHRECDILDVTGFRVPAGAVASDLTDAYRVDAPNRRATRPVGPWDGGIWRLHLRRGDSGWLQIRHSCSGVIVPTALARVPASANPVSEP